MGCASSTPMIQTTGSEMLKAATHVATDAKTTAEDAVEGLKDSVGKSLETAKDSVAATVESVKQEVQNVVKEKVEMVEDAKSSIMEKLHLKQNDNEGSSESNNKNEEQMAKTEMDELKTQLNASKRIDGDIATRLGETLEMQEIKENVFKATDSETDSLKTCTPEPEIEQALSKSHDSQEDTTDNPPTPKPTLSELENLTAEVLEQQLHQHEHEQHEQSKGKIMVSDIKMSNEPLMPLMQENMKTQHDSSNVMLSPIDTNTIKDNEPTAAKLTINDIKLNTVHNIPQISTEVIAKPLQVLSNTTQPLIPLTLATSAMATATAAATYEMRSEPAQPPTAAVPLHQAVAENLKTTKVNKKEDQVIERNEQKRPGTTEWEKFADMLAQMRKYNPHDAFRRGGTLTKFGGGGIGQLRERSVFGYYPRNGMDDDSSDATPNVRGSPHNSQRSSARAIGRVQHSRNRPNTGSNSKTLSLNHVESAAHNAGGNYTFNKPRSNSNVGTTIGRKFDFNPARLRVNDFVSSTSLIQSPLQTTTEPTTQMPSAPYSYSNESVKSPANMRSHHSRNETISLPPLEVLKRTREHFEQEATAQIHHPQHRHEFQHQHQHQNQNQQHPRHDYASSGFDHNDNSLPLQNELYHNETPVLTRQSSNNSLFSNSSCEDNSHSFKPLTSNMRRLPVNQPHHHSHHHHDHHHPPVKNTSSFLATPRCTSFGLTKSYTDLYFSTPGNKENSPNTSSVLHSRNKSPYREQRKNNLLSYKNSP